MGALGDIRIGDQLFCTGHTSTFGSVRDVDTQRGLVDVWIENTGDVAIEADWIVAVHDGKVEVAFESLPERLQQAVQHARDQEAD